MGYIAGFLTASLAVLFTWIFGGLYFAWELETHDHAWEVCGAHQMNLVTTTHGIKLPGGVEEPITEVLYRCTECNDTKTEQLSGHWTYAQLSGQSDPENINTCLAGNEQETTEVESTVPVPPVSTLGDHEAV